MHLLRNEWFWRVVWGALGFCFIGLSAYEATRTGSVADYLGGFGIAALTVTWIVLPPRPDMSFRENVQRNRERLRRLPIAFKLLVPLGFLLMLASLIVRMF